MCKFKVGDKVRHSNEVRFAERGVLEVIAVNQEPCGRWWVRYEWGNDKPRLRGNIREEWVIPIPPAPKPSARMLAYLRSQYPGRDIGYVHDPYTNTRTVAVGPDTGRSTSARQPQLQEFPMGETAQSTTPEERVRIHSELLAQAEADVVKVAERAALKERVYTEIGLGNATVGMLNQIASIRLGNGEDADANGALARYRKELSALAATYGFKIVRIGDKSTAILTEA